MQTNIFVARFFSSLVVLVGFGFSACSSSSGGVAGADAGASDAGANDAASSGDGGPITTLPDGAPVPREHVRIVAGNLSSGNNQNYDTGEGGRIFAGLKADVILIQEFNVGDKSDGAAQAFVETACGPGCSYYREATTYSIPNGIITRFPIISSGDWDDPSTTDREFAWAQIDVPGPIDLYAVSVHLLTSGASQRATQATDLVNLVNANVPAGSYLVIGGDLNTENRDEAATSTFGSIVDTAAPYPADGSKNDNTNQPRSKPHDWVMASPNFLAYTVGVKIGAQTFDPGLVVDTRVFTPISDLAPALATDSAATNMQHMAVVRDFMIPSE